MPACPQCSAPTEPSAWAQHQRSFHVGQSTRSQCPDCSFECQDLARSICHSFLEGHRLAAPPKLSPDVMPPAESDAPANHSLKVSLHQRRPTPKEQFIDRERPLSATDSLACAKCGVLVNCHHRCSIKDHVRVCCGIAPYACSGCRLRSPYACRIRSHLRKQCPGARVEVLDEKASKVAVLKGLSLCFPAFAAAIAKPSGQGPENSGVPATELMKSEEEQPSSQEQISPEANDSVAAENVIPVQQATLPALTEPQQAVPEPAAVNPVPETSASPASGALAGAVLLPSIACVKCGQTASAGALAGHLRLCPGLRSYACSSCKYSSAYASYVQAHLRRYGL